MIVLFCYSIVYVNNRKLRKYFILASGERMCREKGALVITEKYMYWRRYYLLIFIPYIIQIRLLN